MTDKPEHRTDLENGAIVTVQVRPGDAADNAESRCGRIAKAVLTLGEVAPETPVEKLGSELCADEGYFTLGQVARLQACGVRPGIADPQPGRRKPQNASEAHRARLAPRAAAWNRRRRLIRWRWHALARSLALIAHPDCHRRLRCAPF